MTAEPRPPALKFVAVTLSFFLLLNAFWFYGFVRDGLWIALVVGSVFLYRKTGWINFSILALTFTVLTGTLLAAVPRLGLDDMLYPDAHSRMETRDAEGRSIYKRNSRLEMEQPFGDLKRMAGPEQELETQPRHILFQTDDLGFRNESPVPENPRWVLVGDSFIAGNGNSQPDLLASQLKRRGVSIYNLGWPGAIPDYVANIEKFRKQKNRDAKFLLFVFEGNDFLEREKVRVEGLSKIKKGWKRFFGAYKNFFRNTDLYRLTYILYASIKNKVKPKNRVVVHSIGGRPIGFYKRYLEAAQSEQYTFPLWVEEELKRVNGSIAHVFFIPIKYRVLQPLFDTPGKPIPNAPWQALQKLTRQLNIPATNLTPQLIEGTRQLFKQNGRLTFWTDDTHWNRAGTNLVARVVCNTLNEMGCKEGSLEKN
ncbi:MAG: hypothetical protein G3M70_04205 [Candidatus Nitronauta litoralis]|uniref:AlgX/AlgJ SGNH hydrolase-like domain-containing protein n=1 Tax=Candidatus Nitronauta litoralis TaxID=2705533 RepID=A0A7T0BVC7_9BACT|nr:MAG: hypothetical protein G3M70_04205 [Candidatus Nitronauta litoralis]